MPPFPGNARIFAPYAEYAFLVRLLPSTRPVAGVSKVTGLKRSTDVIEYREGGNLLTHKSRGRTRYDDVTLERGITQDREFEEWANAAQVLDKGSPSRSLDFRKEVSIELLNEEGKPVRLYILHRCWVSEFQMLSNLDAGGNGIAIEFIKIVNEGVEQVPIPPPEGN